MIENIDMYFVLGVIFFCIVFYFASKNNYFGAFLYGILHIIISSLFVNHLLVNSFFELNLLFITIGWFYVGSLAMKSEKQIIYKSKYLFLCIFIFISSLAVILIGFRYGHFYYENALTAIYYAIPLLLVTNGRYTRYKNILFN